MSIASKLVLTVALAGFALPALAQGNATPTVADQSNSKTAIHQTATGTGTAVAPATSTGKTAQAKTEQVKTDVVKASTVKPVATTGTAPVTKSN